MRARSGVNFKVEDLPEIARRCRRDQGSGIRDQVKRYLTLNAIMFEGEMEEVEKTIVAAELKRRGHEVVVWDSGRDIESSVMRSWDGPVFSTGARQLSPKNAFSILASILRCRKEMKRAKPDVLIAMGSYSSLPPVLAARMCKVKVLLHEANTVPGKAKYKNI